MNGMGEYPVSLLFVDAARYCFQNLLTEGNERLKTQDKGMTGPVWGKRIAGEAGKANVAYCAGWDVRDRKAADLQLLPYDLWTNRAHCTMLSKAGVIPPANLKKIMRALDKLEKLTEGGEFTLDPALEDVHLNVESFVEAEAGAAVAGQMHTARSRNDQVATDMRLLLRDRLIEFTTEVLDLINTLCRLARANVKTVMPGLTHHQPAAWTTLGHWAASHANAFSRDAYAMLHLVEMLNISPLGAAAAFGTSWPIDRAYAAKMLGFDGPQTNTLDCVTNRSEFEGRAAALIAVWAQHAATLSQDMILFSSPPWHVFRIGDDFVTGSSIMPQKRNPDFAEVTKAKATLAGSTAATLLDLTRGDPSGYNREQQWSKYLIMDLFAELGPAPKVLGGALDSLVLDKKRMRDLMKDDFLEAADVADYLAQTRKVPFRRTYRWLGEAVRISEEEKISLPVAVNTLLKKERGIEPLDEQECANLTSPDFLLQRRDSMGGPAPESVAADIVTLNALARDMRKECKKALASIGKAKVFLMQQAKKVAP